MVLTIGKKGSGKQLAVKRLKLNKGTGKTTLTLAKSDWTRVRASGATLRATLVGPDGKQVLASDSAFARPAASRR